MSIEFSFSGSVGETTAEESTLLVKAARRLYFNLDSGEIYARFDIRSPISRWDAKRGDTQRIHLYIVDEEQEDNEIVKLPAGAELSLSASLSYGGVNLLGHTPWTEKTDADGYTYYESIVSFKTDEINEAIGYGGEEKPRLDLKADIEIVDGGATISSGTFTLRVNNDVTRAEGEPATPASGIRRRGFTFAYWITGRTGGGLSNLDGQATTGLSKGECQVRIKVAGKNEEFDWITDPDPGVTVADGIDVVKPLDYDAVTNPGLFVRIA